MSASTESCRDRHAAERPACPRRRGPARPFTDPEGLHSPKSPIPLPGCTRSGPDAYDHLQPELRLHAASRPDDATYRDRRERLIREFLPLVRNLAARFSATHPVEDLEQVGVLGLIKALDRYDPDGTVGGPLAYLVPTVRGEMLRYVRDHTWAMRVPRHLKDLSVRMNRASLALTQRLGRAPRPSELADEMGVPVSEVVETLGALESYRPMSLDLGAADDDRSPLAGSLGTEDPLLDLVEHRGELRRLIAHLPERERTILLLRFYGDQTQIQIADRLGLSQMHVSRLLSRTLTRLRDGLDATPPADRASARQQPAGARR